MVDAADSAHMARALQLAARGRYGAHPNPMVGCVIVRDGVVVGEGWHEKAGEAHAEINALRIAGNAARGATVYVSLEPCAHHGKTQPCADALAEAGVGRVVAAMEDPFANVAGRGLQRLREARGSLLVADSLFLHDPGKALFEREKLDPHERRRPPPWGLLRQRIDDWLRHLPAGGRPAWTRALSDFQRGGKPVTLHVTSPDYPCLSHVDL